MHQKPQHPQPDPDPLDLPALLSAEQLGDHHLLGALMDPGRQELAVHFLQEGNSLAEIHAMGPLERLALGFTATEATRLHLVGEYLTRLIRPQARPLGCLEAYAQGVLRRATAQGWSRECVGVTCVDAQGTVRVDRILFTGTRREVFVASSEILRECLRAGCEGLVVYRWHPAPGAALSEGDRVILDELRLGASLLRLQVVDYLVITPEACLSASLEQGWID